MKKLKLFATIVIASMSLMLCGCVNKNAVVTVNGDAITRSQYEKAFDAIASNSMFTQMGIDLKKEEVCLAFHAQVLPDVLGGVRK